jgi:hypothetical protein
MGNFFSILAEDLAVLRMKNEGIGYPSISTET